MNPADEEFSETPFYHQREAAILQLLKPGSLMRPPLQCLSGGAIYDFTNAIHYAGCVAGSLGIPLESESVGVHLSLLYRNTTHDRWPEMSRLLSELYARSHSEFIARLKAGFLLEPAQPWALSGQDGSSSAALALRRKSAPACAPPPNHAARRSRKLTASVLKRS